MKLYYPVSAVLFATVSITAGCGSSAYSEAAGGPPSATSADTLAAQQSVQAVDDAGGSDMGTASHGAAFLAMNATETWGGRALIPGNFNTIITSAACSPSLNGNVTNVNGVITLDANLIYTASACQGRRKLDGHESIHGVWANANSHNRTVTVTDNLTVTFADGSTTTVTSLDPPTAYTFSYTGTGRPIDGNTTLSISLNEHRVRDASNGNRIFDHNITTPTPIQVNNTFATTTLTATPQTRTVVSGTINIHHNIAHFGATHEFTNVVRDLTGQCLCPQSGTMVQTVTKDDGAGTYVRTYTFTGCGSATVATSASTLADTKNGSATITWNNCQI